MTNRNEPKAGAGPSKPAVFHRDSAKKIQRSGSNLSATSGGPGGNYSSGNDSKYSSGNDSKFVREKRQMVSLSPKRGCNFIAPCEGQVNFV